MAEQKHPRLSPVPSIGRNPPPPPSPASSAAKQKRKDEIHSLEPRAYADAVAAHSSHSISDSLYPGNAFSNLASYLRSPYERYARDLSATTKPSNSRKQCFAAHYDMSLNAARKAVHLHSVDEFNRLHEASSTIKSPAQILFLNGHPSPQWLNAIGGKYRVDPEFYQRHLDFRAAVSRPDYFTLPALPSASEKMVKLRITTIGYRQPRLRLSGYRHPQKYLDGLRADAAKGMEDYENTLKMEDKWNTGDSIVRDFAIIDAEHCIIEQDISVCIDRVGHGWMALVWLDIGATLEISPHGPWISSKKQKEDPIDLLPTIQHKSKIALKNTSLPSTLLPMDNCDNGEIFQSASLLHLDYGRKLDLETASTNPLYALSDIFRFAANSELQFLNMLATKITNEMDPAILIQQEDPTVSNLLYSRKILERHIQRIEEYIQFIDVQGNLSSPKPPKGEAAANSLRKDFQVLLSRSQGLSAQCDRGMTIIMNNATIRESQRAIVQAEGVAKLTRLAFVFVPSSFTASLFGMNVKQFGTGASVEIWVYFMVTMPIMAISILFLMVDVIGICQSFFSWVAKARARQAKIRTNSYLI